MKKVVGIGLVLAGLALAPMLGGCQTGQIISAASGFSITQQQLDAARNAYDGSALATLHTYAGWPRCASGTALSATNQCHDPALLKKMRNADKTVETAFTSVQNQITSGNSSGAVAAWNTLQVALGVAQSIITQNNLGAI